MRAALVAVGALPADALDAEVFSLVALGRLSAVSAPDGSRQCYWGSVFLCSLPPDPVAAWRASVDARLRDGLSATG